MNFELPYIPDRDRKPRKTGLTMVMDKGLGLKETEAFIEANGHLTDLVKLGFGTSYVTRDLEKKLALYREADIRPYFGGTLFEAFVVRNLFDDFCRLIAKFKMDVVEISDGSMEMDHADKLGYIKELSKHATVLSEVGSKQASVVIPIPRWVNMMKSELDAGAWKVIAEAREAGNIGIYKSDGSANTDLIAEIVQHVKTENILWEAPNKGQQVYFLKLLGYNANLGNIATNDVVPLECLRLGLRGDTFFDNLPRELKK